VLDHARQFLPATLFVLLHDRRDQDVVWILFLDLPKLVQPNVDRSIGDEFDVFETDNFACTSRTKFPVTRNDIHDLRRLEADSLSDSAAPTRVKRFRKHASICSRRSRTEDERVGKLHAVDSD